MRDRSKRRKFARNYKPTFHLGKIGLTVATAGLVLVLGLLYLSQSNQMATSGYDIAKLEKQQKQLLEDSERLQLEASRLQSIQQIDAGIKDSGMVPVKKINYLPGGTSVAINIK